MEHEKYNCLVVDDEPIARRIIVGYIDQMPLLQLATECINPLTAIEYLRTYDNVDIIFLDINMPNLSGLQLLKIIKPKQPVIFTTAYSEYAVESYEVNAVDYLLKPFSFERFTTAVYRSIAAIDGSNKLASEIASEKSHTIFIKSDGRIYPTDVDDILYCEAMKNYTMVKLKNDRRLMPLVPLSKFELLLSDAGAEFIQVHRSYIISKKHIKAISASLVSVDKYDIPIGVQFREKFFKIIGLRSQ
jgi:DNA-binding LytR/AlgR family response regulator